MYTEEVGVDPLGGGGRAGYRAHCETTVRSNRAYGIVTEGQVVFKADVGISCGGIAILDNKMILGDAIGKEYVNCRIDLPEIGQVTTALQVRNSLDLTLLNNKTNRRLGCEFVNIQRSMLAYVQRYITKLERERNARIAGLG